MRDWNTVLVMIKPSGWTGPQRARIRSLALAGGFDLSWLADIREDELNLFHQLPGEPIHGAARTILSGRAKDLFRKSPFDLRPATRDRPYFYKFLKTSRLDLAWKGGQGSGLAVSEWGLLFLWGGLGAALLASAAGILIPLPFLKPRPPGLSYFGLIGLAYMIAELTLLNELIVILGNPALALPVAVGSFLLASGLGSRVWGGRRPFWFALTAGLMLPPVLLALRALGPGAWAAPVLIAPAALVMGAPFAGGLNHLAGPEAGARAWAFGVNGFFAVVGSSIAALICIQAGHTASILTAGGLYLLAALVYGRVERCIRA